MKRRSWTAADPEPDGVTDVMDEWGEVWCHEDDSRGFTCACGEHTCSFPDQVGWYCPTWAPFHELRPWADIFTAVHSNGQKASKVTELTPAEAAEMCREMYS